MGVDDCLVVDEALDVALVQAHLEGVPFTWAVVGTCLFLEHLPRENIGPVEARQAQPAVAGVEAVMAVAAVGVKGQSGGAGLILEAHGDGDLAGQGGWSPARKAQRTAAEA